MERTSLPHRTHFPSYVSAHAKICLLVKELRSATSVLSDVSVPTFDVSPARRAMMLCRILILKMIEAGLIFRDRRKKGVVSCTGIMMSVLAVTSLPFYTITVLSIDAVKGIKCIDLENAIRRTKQPGQPRAGWWRGIIANRQAGQDKDIEKARGWKKCLEYYDFI